MSKYNYDTEGKNIVADFPSEVKGRTFLITGPSEGGVGAETAISLAQGNPSTIILLGRSPNKAEPTIASIRATSPSTVVKFVTVDLGSLASVRSATNTILADTSIPNIDAMINNAAIMVCPYSKSVDGFELQFATNHLSHFLLTNLLIPKLLASPHPRVVNVSSSGHSFSPIRFLDPGFSDGKAYGPWQAYGQAKTANILMAVELNKKYGGKVRGLAAHPGSIPSGLQGFMTEELRDEALDDFKRQGRIGEKWKTLQQGCATQLRAALDPSLDPKKGVFYNNCQVGTKESSVPVEDYAVDEENARKLWEMSEEMVGEKFGN